MAATLTVDVEHLPDLLALYVTSGGQMVDPVAVEVQVMDLDGGEPGTELFPAAGGWEDMLTVGKRSTGVYDVIDGSAPWKHNAAVARGRVNWRHKLAATDDWTYVRRSFQVLLAATTGSDAGEAVAFLIQDLRDVGVTLTIASDVAVYLQSVRLLQLAERFCRQHLRPYFGTMRFHGYDNRTLPLPEPLVGAQSVTEHDRVLDLDHLIVWGYEGEERRNPRLEVALTDPGSSIYTAPGWRRTFDARLMIYVVGVWGFFDPDTFDMPELVRQALINEGASVFGVTPSTGGGSAAGAVKREKTDGHEIEYAVQASTVRPGGLSLMDQATRDTLLLYKAPIAIGAPRTKWV